MLVHQNYFKVKTRATNLQAEKFRRQEWRKGAQKRKREASTRIILFDFFPSISIKKVLVVLAICYVKFRRKNFFFDNLDAIYTM